MTPRPSAERYQRLGATILVPVDQKRNSSSAVVELRFIELPSIYRRNAICMRIILSGGQVIFLISPKMLVPQSTRLSGSMRAICPFRGSWQLICKALAANKSA